MPNDDVVHKETRPAFGGKTINATVVLADGRIGMGHDRVNFVGSPDKAKALSAAIHDARSKPVPKK